MTFVSLGQSDTYWHELKQSLKYKKHEKSNSKNTTNDNGSSNRSSEGRNGEYDRSKGTEKAESSADWNSIDDASEREGLPRNYQDGTVRGGIDNETEPFKGTYEEFDINDWNFQPGDGREYGPANRSDDIKRRRTAEEEKKREEEEKKRQERENSKMSMSSGMSNGIMVLAIILLAIVLAVIAFQIYTNRSGGKSKVNLNKDNFSIEEISKTDLELALDDAVKQQNYRGAIRVYFLFAIKDLSEKGWIKWEKEKTNTTYLYEMRAQSVYQEFENVVSIYEIAWYGKRQISEEDFKSVEPAFKSLLHKLGVK